MLRSAAAAVERHDRLVLGGLLVLATALRFVDLATRGQWDADQGHDMLVLRDLARNGVVPLLGPPTSIGEFHHGALYYYVLAPFALLTGGDDPVAILAAIAAANVAAVGATWWIARAAGGWLAGLVAALLMTVSASAIEESTFIWNPNVIALASSVAIAGAWRAYATSRERWWLVAAAGLALTMHSHVLGVTLAPAIVALFVLDLRRRVGSRRPLWLAGIAGVAIVALSYVPLLVHELGNGFPESRAALAFLSGGGDADPGPSAPTRLLFVALRVLSWPLSGLVTDAPFAAVLAAALVVVLGVWLAVQPAGPRRTLARWLGATLAWCTIALAVGARSLATVVPGFPNDHYHAFLDPIVFAIVGAGVARLALGNAAVELDRSPDAPPAASRAATDMPDGAGALGTARVAAAVLIVGAIVAFNVTIWPPRVADDGGWPAAQGAADRVTSTTGGRPIALVGLPELKSPDMLGYPLARAVSRFVEPPSAGALVVVCDRFLEDMIGAACGGPAEDGALAAATAAGFGGGAAPTLADRFEASPRTVVSVYTTG